MVDQKYFADNDNDRTICDVIFVVRTHAQCTYQCGTKHALYIAWDILYAV